MQSRDIAIIGISGRFPGAENIAEFWANLREGVESITHFGVDEVDPEVLELVGANVVSGPSYRTVAPLLKAPEHFDAAFFDLGPREAETLDVQHRLFLECAYQALEDAAYDPTSTSMMIGVFGGGSFNPSALFHDHLRQSGRLGTSELLELIVNQNPDYLSTRVSYKLGLRGPSLTVQTACSTSLVAVHLACQSLRSGECEMALAGGVSVKLPAYMGYNYQAGGIFSEDGHCRSFDARATGTIFGSGVGVVLLKPLAEALDDRDHIYAVIKGSAINNDGAMKIGYGAPSLEGQSDVIIRALRSANVSPDTIGYVEAHGTATLLGDPIEVAALTRAFRHFTDRTQYCALGSVKTNVGHLDGAAGVTGLIKAILAVAHGEIPRSLHYERPNPHIDFESSPFFVAGERLQWPLRQGPRRAGVNAFGIGGTNAHVILEQAPVRQDSTRHRKLTLLTWSANTERAVERIAANLREYLARNVDVEMADVAFSLQVGRRSMTHRRSTICQGREDAVRALSEAKKANLIRWTAKRTAPPVVFLFPGQGTQYPGMGEELYREENVFREAMDECAHHVAAEFQLDLLGSIYSRENDSETAPRIMSDTFVTQLSLFAIEYSLARLWLAWGITPEAMIGHSLGEYVAACVAGVFSLSNAIRIVGIRGRLMQSLPEGRMLSVIASEKRLRTMLEPEISISAVNGPELVVLSGPEDVIQRMSLRLAEAKIHTNMLASNRAFHSPLMASIASALEEEIERLNPLPPEIPYVSNLSGTWIDRNQATNPSYWSQHAHHAVMFGAGIQKLLKNRDRIFLEVGPGSTLSSLTRANQHRGDSRNPISSLGKASDKQSNTYTLLKALGELWSQGVQPDWLTVYSNQERRRLSLPTYPFERQLYTSRRGAQSRTGPDGRKTLVKRQHLREWFYYCDWSTNPPSDYDKVSSPALQTVLVMCGSKGLSRELLTVIKQDGIQCVEVNSGEKFGRVKPNHYMVNPENKADYIELLTELQRESIMPDRVIHLWNVEEDGEDSVSQVCCTKAQGCGYYSLLYLVQAWQALDPDKPKELVMISSDSQRVVGDETIRAEKAMSGGLLRVVSQEYPSIVSRWIDVSTNELKAHGSSKIATQLHEELLLPTREFVTALRHGRRWVQRFRQLMIGAGESGKGIRDGGVYLITGGLGDVGHAIARYLCKEKHAKVVLTGRSAPPVDTSDGKDDAECVRALRFRDLVESGGQVHFISADCSDEMQMRSAVCETCLRFGRLDGVVHAAGDLRSENFKKIEELGELESEAQFKTKVQGVRVLERVLEGRTLEFCVLASSLASILGGIGLGAYSAANAFVDAFVQERAAKGGSKWLAVNWDHWVSRAFGGSGSKYAMTPSEGVETLKQILDSPHPEQVLVATSDLEARIDKYVTPIRSEKLRSLGEAVTSYPRPDLENPYVAPNGELESRLASVWQQFLRIDQIGRNDNFFDLGGDSLLGTQLASRLRDTFAVEIPLRTLLENATIAGIARILDESRDKAIARPTDLEERLAQIWSEVLCVDGIGVSDDFFELGGSSLLATRVLSLVKSKLNLELPVSCLLANRTLKDFGRQVEHAILEDVSANSLKVVLDDLEDEDE